MYENVKNTELKGKIISAINEQSNSRQKVLQILNKELKEVTLSEHNEVSFCSCGYPINCRIGDDIIWLYEILKEEVDFRSYRIFYSCPKCDALLLESSQ